MPEYIGAFTEMHKVLKDAELIDLNSTYTATPETLSKFKDFHAKYRGELEYFISYFRKFTPIQYTEEKPEEQIKEIRGDKSIRNFRLADSYIKLDTTVEMYDPTSNVTFNFGNFNIMMCEEYATCEPTGDNTFKDQFFHPYVDPGNYKLCMGDFKESYKSFWRSMSYANCWFVVKKIMTQYGLDHDDRINEAAPFARFSAWIGNQCVECGDIMDNSETYLCSFTDKKICSSCADGQKDEVTGRVYMSHFIDKCDVCEMNRYDVKPVDEKKVCRSCRSVTK